MRTQQVRLQTVRRSRTSENQLLIQQPYQGRNHRKPNKAPPKAKPNLVANSIPPLKIPLIRT